MDVGRDRPVLPGEGAFEGEARSEAWARAHEDEVRARLEKIGVVAEKVECRTSRCQLVVSGEGAKFDE
ncbi:MAG TPA: hypothetical protein VL172_18450, partial [Kofleriaceae bacterium]|nr:hypothetical protein [Kofleriaceae bacterium]